MTLVAFGAGIGSIGACDAVLGIGDLPPRRAAAAEGGPPPDVVSGGDGEAAAAEAGAAPAEDATARVDATSGDATSSCGDGECANCGALGSSCCDASCTSSNLTCSAKGTCACAGPDHGTVVAGSVSYYGLLGGGLAFDAAGNLFVAETWNDRGVLPEGPFVSKITPNGQRTIFTGQNEFGGVTAIKFDRQGYLYVGDGDGYRVQSVERITNGLNLVWRVDPQGNASHFVTGIMNPTGLAFDSSQNLYVASYADRAIYKFSPLGAPLGAFATDLPAAPYGLAFDEKGTLFFAAPFVDPRTLVNNQRVYEVTPDGQVSVFFDATALSTPVDLVFDRRGDLYVSYYTSLKILRFAPDGSHVVLPGGGCNGDDAPNGLAISPAGVLFTVVNGGRTTPNPAVIELPGFVP
jgi:sugar lactone lactonase YvrE